MRDFLKLILSVFIGVLVVALLGWIATANQLGLAKVFGPAFEQTRRETFEQTKSFRDGNVQELRAMQYEYLQADPIHRAGLAAVIRHKAVGVPADAIPADLQLFLEQIK